MPPKVDPSEIRFCNIYFILFTLLIYFFFLVRIKVFGGEPGPAATLAPKLGPLGLVIYLHL